ncbi:hypothetical protein HHK36_002780 [Tetracentron sinense]|uniref:BZIP domain-containing protein n=1 Tax=Tetracentron sinense TaxID=13715 RepID=A0A834ZMU6_TETSI|nr:hypothetical protein HHK36_002780 [Tetracentron sinense]
MLSLDGLSEFLFPDFEEGFTPLENQEALSLLQTQNPFSLNSGSDEPNSEVSGLDQQKKRRMKSNRESAKRSRMRKKRHLEELRNEENRLRTENREMENRLCFISHHCQLIRRDNIELLSETILLQQRLLDVVSPTLIFR